MAMTLMVCLFLLIEQLMKCDLIKCLKGKLLILGGRTIDICRKLIRSRSIKEINDAMILLLISRILKVVYSKYRIVRDKSSIHHC